MLLHIELTNQCNAACPVCTRYVGGSEILNPEMDLNSISVDDFKKWFPLEFVNRSYRWTFCGTAGDPLMAKDVYEILEYVSNNSKAGIQLNTNGGIRNPEFFIKLGNLFKSQTDRYVVFSVDGLEDTNHIYRRNVNWNKVLENMKAYGATGAVGQWDFLIFKHNEHQIEDAKKLCNELGITYFAPKRAFGFEQGNTYGDLPVYDKEFKFQYFISPPTQLQYRNNENVQYIPATSIPRRNPNIQKKSKEERTLQWNKLFDTELKKYKFPDELKKMSVTCGSLVSETVSEIFVNANGLVFPCCYIGTWFGGAYKELNSLNMRKKLEDYGLDKINLYNHSLKAIIDSDYMDTCFASNWDSCSNDNDKLEFCFRTCGKYEQLTTSDYMPEENLWQDRLFVDKDNSAF